MAEEVLYIPEEALSDVIRVINAGIYHIQHTNSVPLSQDTINNLLLWCAEEEQYLKNLQEDGE